MAGREAQHAADARFALGDDEPLVDPLGRRVGRKRREVVVEHEGVRVVGIARAVCPQIAGAEIVSATRRLAAILAVDVVGYSRLMGEDEAGTAKAVRERREAAQPIVRSFGGRVVKTMGDGVLLEFPSVVAAVECVIAIQKLFAERNAGLAEGKRILYRVGVNLGDVLIEGDDILGDGVNVAARLEQIAEPGGVCLSGSAYDHVRGRVEPKFADLGEQRLKNIAEPVRAYSLSADAVGLAPAPSPGAPASRTGLLGVHSRCGPHTHAVTYK